MPGTQEEMTKFQEDTVSSSKVHVECTFPRLDVNLHTKDDFENIYNRLVRLKRRNGSFTKYVKLQSLGGNLILLDLKSSSWLDRITIIISDRAIRPTWR